MPPLQSECRYAKGFSLWEKLWAQLSFFTMLISGTAGIARADWHWLAPYLVVAWYGVPGIVMRYQTCPNVPICSFTGIAFNSRLNGQNGW